jgi:hypothetical protein
MKFLTQFFLALIVVCAAVLIGSPAASAHVLKVDGAIGATLHVDPADNPVAGSPASFYFEIKDREGKFSPLQCTCTVDIKTQAGQVLHTEKLFTESSSAGLSTPLLNYTFVSGGVYRVTLSGSPQSAGTFQSFSVSYDVRVENAGAMDAHGSDKGDTWLYVGLAAVLLVTFGLATLQRKKKNKPVSLLALLFGVIAAGNVLFYSGHFFAVAAPVHVHHHVASETGHADAEYQNLAPHTPATVVVHFFLLFLLE